MYIYIYIYSYTSILTCVCTYIHTHIYMCVWTCERVYIYTSSIHISIKSPRCSIPPEASSSVPSSVAPGVSSSPQRFARADSPASLPGPVHLEPVTLAVAGSQRATAGENPLGEWQIMVSSCFFIFFLTKSRKFSIFTCRIWLWTNKKVVLTHESVVEDVFLNNQIGGLKKTSREFIGIMFRDTQTLAEKVGIDRNLTRNESKSRGVTDSHPRVPNISCWERTPSLSVRRVHKWFWHWYLDISCVNQKVNLWFTMVYQKIGLPMSFPPHHPQHSGGFRSLEFLHIFALVWTAGLSTSNSLWSFNG